MASIRRVVTVDLQERGQVFELELPEVCRQDYSRHTHALEHDKWPRVELRLQSWTRNGLMSVVASGSIYLGDSLKIKNLILL